MTKTKTKRSDERPADVYQRVTDQIVEAIEKGIAKGNEWRRPWHTTGGCAFSPRNVVSRKAYRGVNTLCLWAAAQAKGYVSGEWATYKQWEEKGAQVRKGEKATMVVFWKFASSSAKEEQDGGGDTEATETAGRSRLVMTRGYYVFNAAQVDGYTATTEPERTGPERIASAEAFLTAIGADVRHGGNSAHYSPSTDHVQMPPLAAFTDAPYYYSTLSHELTHWTAPASRCDRQLGKRFGDAAYAAEELIAELGAAFLCGQLELESEPRPDHAQYVAHWLEVLKRDKHAIFTASSRAQAAVDFLTKRSEAGRAAAPASAGKAA